MDFYANEEETMTYAKSYPHKFQDDPEIVSAFLEEWVEGNQERKRQLDFFFAKPEFFPYLHNAQSTWIWSQLGRFVFLISPSESSKGLFKYLMIPSESKSLSLVKVKFQMHQNGTIDVFNKDQQVVERFENYESMRKKLLETSAHNRLEPDAPRTNFLFRFNQDTRKKLKPQFSVFAFQNYFKPHSRSIHLHLLKDETKVYFNFDILSQWSSTLRNLTEDFQKDYIEDLEIPEVDQLSFALYVIMNMCGSFSDWQSSTYSIVPKDILSLIGIKNTFEISLILYKLETIYHLANFLGDDKLVHQISVILIQNFSSLDKYSIQSLFNVIQF